MKTKCFKLMSLLMTFVMLVSITSVAASAAVVDYTITNPYESVTDLLGDMENHYKTNLHSHSTYSDANYDMVTMINEFYDQDYDILAFSDHGVIGREWDEEPTLIDLYKYQLILGNPQKHLTTEEYHAVLGGTYVTEANRRTKARGMQCVTGAIEANMLVLAKNHVNGYFTESCEGYLGDENNFEEVVKRIHEDGGVSHINHPGDWLHSAGDADIARDPKNVAIFADIIKKYDSCLGIEAFNAFDRPTRNDRILWDELLKEIIPEGNRNVWGFSNSDAHAPDEVDTSFMDFILPEYSMGNVRTAMENGTFFAVSRYAQNELGDDFEATTDAYPQVTEITVDEDADTITIKAINCNAIDWIADGNIIQSEFIEADGEMVTTMSLREHADNIGCYVRAQFKGQGGICCTQAFICNDGSMGQVEENPTYNPTPAVDGMFSDFQEIFDFLLYILKNNKIAVLIEKLS